LIKPPVNIEDLMSEWSKDTVIDSTSMELELLKISNLHGKYLNIMSYHRHLVRKMETDYKVLKGLREEYYHGRLTKEELDEHGWEQWQARLSNPEVARKLDTDQELNNLLLKRIAHEEIVEYCNGVLKSIHNRSWDLKTYCDYMKFTAGK